MRGRETIRVRLLAGVAIAALALGFAACGDDDDSDDGGGSEATAAAAAQISTDTTTKPKVVVPEGEPPAALQIEDVVEGDGAEAGTGDTATVHYVGVDFATGEQFDASWDNNSPFPFTIGDGNVIPGWDLGVAGMKEGGRRMLVIPPDLAYGEQGQPPDIAPNATLVFVIDLISVD